MEAVIEMRNVSKYFAKVVANYKVDLELHKGEILALLGENGAGKSTIMKVLFGLYSQEEGQIFIHGKETKIGSPKDAMKHGIAMIQQHFSLVDSHTVTENIILGQVSGKIDLKSYSQKVQELIDKYGFKLNPNALIRDLAVGDRQKVEILKALYQKAEILIMDEPSAVLTPQEITTLIKFIKDYVKDGNSVVFISHKLNEVMEVSDNIVIMRAGRVVDKVVKTKTNQKELAKLMVGRELDLAPQRTENYVQESQSVLEVSGVSSVDREGRNVLEDVSFQVHSGEIFGIAGVSGNGQQELCEAIYGIRSICSGDIKVCGQDLRDMSVYQRIHFGLGYVPSNRHRDAMVPSMSIQENMFLKASFEQKWQKHGLIAQKTLKEYSEGRVKEFNVVTPDVDTSLQNLSGGNQQKVILAREVDNGQKLIILDQPTRGLDLGAINQVHNFVIQEAKLGKAVLLISTELSEVFGLCDRVGVIYEGKIQGIYNTSELTSEKIGLMMAGGGMDEN